MSRWFRFYDDVINDPKVLCLPEAMRWSWVAVLCAASKNDGALPALEHLALMLRVAPQRAASILAELCKAGLLDKTEAGFAPHNWNGRQYKSDVTDSTAAQRMKRYRDNKRNDRNDTVTVIRPETETETDNRTEKKETRVTALDDWPDDFREQFWAKYPNKVGKPKAISKLEGARKRGVSWVSLMDGLDRYIRGKPSDRAWLNPETFINQDRWSDQPAGAALIQEKAPELNIEDAVRMFSKTRHWSKWAGPEPGLSGCKASPELLGKYGLMVDGRKLENSVTA